MPELMKGKVWAEHKHKLRYPVLAEVKHDEIRLHVKLVDNEVQFLSYAGKPLHNLRAFEGRFGALLLKEKLTELDCGVEVNGNYNDSYRYVRSSTGVPKDLVNAGIKFFLFDCPGIDKEFSFRHGEVDFVADSGRQLDLPLYRPERSLLHNEASVVEYFHEVRSCGYEGLMVKSLEHKYQPGKRIDGWLKLKPEETFDGKITGINRAYSIHGEPLHRAGSVDVLLEDGTTASPAGIAHAIGTDMWDNPEKYIGRWVEFKCMERDRAGGYRHPFLHRFREDKQ